mmetsp:Transcript_56118/g.147378  ORF Transcript_56118/g.147378 Transcript_56118/m.147378 type:complete len:198 (+) Transcript_56118:100-693(+)
MGVPNEEAAPPIVSAVKGHGTRWWPAFGDEPKSYDPPTPEWADAATPPWLLSPQSARDACVPFGEAGAGLQTVCCGAMIKYFEVAAGRAAGFVQFEESLKSWDHACGLICVSESGGIALDGAGEEVLFADRTFTVTGGIVCSSKWAHLDEQTIPPVTVNVRSAKSTSSPAPSSAMPPDSLTQINPQAWSQDLRLSSN